MPMLAKIQKKDCSPNAGPVCVYVDTHTHTYMLEPIIY